MTTADLAFQQAFPTPPPPTKRRTNFHTLRTHDEIASSVDMDRVASILRDAEGGDCRGLFALYRDIVASHSHLQGRFSERKEAVTGDTLSIQPADKKNPDDQFAAKVIESQIGNLPNWETACLHLLDSTLYPVAVVEKIFRMSTTVIGGRPLRYEVASLVPVPHDLLDFSDGTLRIRDTDDQGTPLSTSHVADGASYIIHRGHSLTMPDNWGGPLRSLVFWWLFGTMGREWWARFLDKYGTPFMVGKYDQADDATRSIMERAFSLATKPGGLVVSRGTEVEIKQAAASDAGSAFETFHRVANAEISKLILGQTLSSDASATGMNSGVAAAQDGIRQDKRMSDARRLGTTLRFQLFVDILRYNGLAGREPVATWGSISVAEMKATADWLTSLKTAGLRVQDAGLETLSERFGMPIERDLAPEPVGGGGFFPMSVRMHRANGPHSQVHQANDAILRTGAARLAQALGKTYAPLEALIATSTSPDDLMRKVETYCATLDPVSAADILEQSLIAFTANGSVVSAR
ncbi:phage portal protein family protein [Geminisphaera colitermitum]|uniref:phage portal protein family protein n=1 Tax=Geminisphaera colitermitum TaxID=1148786 RepID=UPI000158C72D|nr:DUF935 family protein [Geminisphaera colitermitum]